MQIVADFTVIPIGVGVSLSKYVAEVEKEVKASGLKYLMHSCGTLLTLFYKKEGEWDQVMQLIKTCHDKLHQLGVPRVHTNVSIGSRTDKLTSIDGKIDAVNQILNS